MQKQRYYKQQQQQQRRRCNNNTATTKIQQKQQCNNNDNSTTTIQQQWCDSNDDVTTTTNNGTFAWHDSLETPPPLLHTAVFPGIFAATTRHQLLAADQQFPLLLLLFFSLTAGIFAMLLPTSMLTFFLTVCFFCTEKCLEMTCLNKRVGAESSGDVRLTAICCLSIVDWWLIAAPCECPLLLFTNLSSDTHR